MDVDQVGLICEKMEARVMQERLRFENIYNLVEDYLVNATDSSKKRDSRIIIGGPMGVHMLLQRQRTYDDFQYILYTENSLIHANNLTNAIAASVGESPIVKLRTPIPDIKYEIHVDGRPLVIIFTLRSDVKTYDLIEPVKVKSFDGKRELLVLSPEVHLLDVYRTLSSPADVGSWGEALVYEKCLYELLQKRLSILGGDSEEIKPEERTKIEEALLRDFVGGNKQLVLLGEHAIKILGKGQTSSNVIYVISSANEESDFAKIKSIVHKALGREIPVTKNSRSSNVMQDFRLTRNTIKIGADGQKKEVMYIYNSASFDLVPYNVVTNKQNVQIQIANPFVLMRFLLVDLWMIRWVREMGKVNEFFAKKRIHNILSHIVNLRKEMSNSNATIKDELFSGKGPFAVFQKDQYIGTHIDESITVRLNQLASEKRYVDYYPQGYYFTHKSYRVFGF